MIVTTADRLDATQYEQREIRKYEAIYGRNFVSPGGRATAMECIAMMRLMRLTDKRACVRALVPFLMRNIDRRKTNGRIALSASGHKQPSRARQRASAVRSANETAYAVICGGGRQNLSGNGVALS